MPAIHGMLTDDQFLKYGNLAANKGMSIKELTTALAVAEIQKLSNEMSKKED